MRDAHGRYGSARNARQTRLTSPAEPHSATLGVKRQQPSRANDRGGIDGDGASLVVSSRTVFLLTCRDAETDFRRPLAEALAAIGHEVFYIRLQRRPTLNRIGGDGPQTVSMPAFVAWMIRACRSADRPLVFNSTNLVFPWLTTLLTTLCGGLWCFDMHDDLLYDKLGANRIRASRAQRRKLASSDLVVYAAATLSERFPEARHLGNASDMVPAAHPFFDASRVLILASLDQRVDFDFLDEVARLNPSVEFVIVGQVAEGANTIAARLFRSTDHHRNIVYRGPYDSAGLIGLMAEFSLSLAPYRVNSRLTRYIDPLRYYHCLNSGLELLTTDIPQAHRLTERLHILHAPAEFARVTLELNTNPAARRNANPQAHLTTWRQRAGTLMKIVEEYECAKDGSRHGRRE